MLFTRFCTTGVSLLTVCPRSRFAGRLIEHFDFSAVASLTRNLIECYLAFFYLCIEDIVEDEWLARLHLLQLNDCKSRQWLFRQLDPQDPHLTAFDVQANELRDKLRNNPYFAALPEPARRRFLTGRHPHFLKRDEILARAKLNVDDFRATYHFFSTHVHSGPLAFYRMGEREQGRGIENDVEKGHMVWALEAATDLSNRAIGHVLHLFPDIPRAKDSQGGRE